MRRVKQGRENAVGHSQTRVRLTATVVVGSLIALFLAACGEGNGFKGSDTKKPPKKKVEAPVQAAPAARTEQEIKGYEIPDLRGTDSKLIGGGPAVLPPPVDPTNSSTPTTIEDGVVTNIGDPTGVINSGQSTLTCPGSIPFTDGTCIPTAAVFLWNKEGAVDLSAAILSLSNDACDTAEAVCDHLKTHATPKGFRALGSVAFRSFQADADVVTDSPSAFTKVSICHDSVPTAGIEKIVEPGNALQTSACASVYDTFVGLVSPLKGTVPVYRWQKGSAVILTLSASDEPAAGYTTSPQPVFYALPPG